MIDDEKRIIFVIILAIIVTTGAISVLIYNKYLQRKRSEQDIMLFSQEISKTTDYYYENELRCSIIPYLSNHKVFAVCQGCGFDLYADKDGTISYIGSFSDGDTLYYSGDSIIASYTETRQVYCLIQFDKELDYS